MALQKEIWIADIKENPVPDNSFVLASTDKSEYVENNKLHLAEAGVEPVTHKDYFKSNTGELPTANPVDVPSEVVLATFSTEQTRHRRLEEIELQYNRRQSIIQRHKTSLAKNLGKEASYAWTPATSTPHNKVLKLGASDSLIDAIIDLQAFYAGLDKSDINICLSPDHMARIRKEDKRLYKDILSEKGALLYGFKIYGNSANPIYTDAGVKKPFGSVADSGDRVSSFTWCSEEVFRCFGDVEMYEATGHPGLQADIISFAQRALVGNIRAAAPKYLGAII